MGTIVIISIIAGIAGVIAGIIAGKFIFAKDTKKQIEDAEQQAQRIISDAQVQGKHLKKKKFWRQKKNLCN
ncbi:MAG: Rnase Y domain-containing protein [Segetibacter sp.]